MLTRHLVSARSACCLVALAASACHRPPEPPAGESKPQATASATTAPAPSADPPKSLHDRLDEAMDTAPNHPPPDNTKSIVVWHILIAYRGAAGAPNTVTRTKDDAKALAASIDVQVRAGGDFDGLASKYSDDPKVKTNHGKLGKIERNQMDKAFTDYAFALLKFETGPVPLETPAGFEIIRRME